VDIEPNKLKNILATSKLNMSFNIITIYIKIDQET